MSYDRMALYFSKLKHTVAQNFLSLSLWNMALIVLSFITMPYLIRVIGLERYGLLAIAQAFIQFFTFLLDYGFNYSSVREISVNRHDAAKVSSIFSAVMMLKLIFLGIVFFIVIASCMLFSRFRNDWQLYILTFSCLIGYGLSPSFLLMGMERMKIMVYFSSSTIVFTLLIFVFVKSKDDFMMVPILNGLGSLLSAQAAHWFVRKNMHITWTFPQAKQVMCELKDGARMFFSNLLAIGHSNVRIFLVGILRGNVITAYYVVGERLLSMMVIFPLGVLTQALYPRLCHVFEKDRSRIRRLINQVQRSVNFIYLIFCCVAYLYAPKIITLICGVPAPIAIASYRLLIFSVFLTAINAFSIQWLLAAGLFNTVSRISIITGLAGMICAYPFIKIFSYQGAAYSFILILIIAFWMTWIEKKKAFSFR